MYIENFNYGFLINFGSIFYRGWLIKQERQEKRRKKSNNDFQCHVRRLWKGLPNTEK